jgi:hypothetical protein
MLTMGKLKYKKGREREFAWSVWWKAHNAYWQMTITPTSPLDWNLQANKATDVISEALADVYQSALCGRKKKNWRWVNRIVSGLGKE